MFAEDVLEIELSEVWCRHRGVRRDKEAHLGEAIDDDEDGVEAVAERQRFDEIQGDG